MYWSECGKHAAIESGALDGASRKTLVSQGLNWPIGLTVDYPARTLYWIDSKLRLVECISLDTNRRKKVYRFTSGKNSFFLFRQRIAVRDSRSIHFADMKPHRVDLFEDYLYIAFYQNSTVLRLNKFGHNDIQTFEAGITKVSDLVVYQENKQYVTGKRQTKRIRGLGLFAPM